MKPKSELLRNLFSVALMKKSIDAVLENDMDMADLYLTEGKEV